MSVSPVNNQSDPQNFSTTLQCAGRVLDLSRPRVMGVLNVTPDSFSDGGQFIDPAAALDQALRLQAEGAAIIDVGGESTRPGARPVDAEQELRRVMPVIEALVERLEVPISIDTSKPEVMRAAVDAGAGLVNDVGALQAEGALQAVADSDAAVCLMHMQGEPRTMQADPVYTDVVTEVRDFLAGRIAACEAAGIERQRIVVDPGFGFGKTLTHNLQLLAGLQALGSLQCPVLVGLSRKSMFKMLLNANLDQRLPGSLSAAVLAVVNGARIVRSHDVWQTVHALDTAWAVLQHNPGRADS